jgi:hypothetical protein
MYCRWSVSAVLGWTIFLSAGCQTQSEPSAEPTPKASPQPVGSRQVTLHVPEMTQRLKLA